MACLRSVATEHTRAKATRTTNFVEHRAFLRLLCASAHKWTLGRAGRRLVSWCSPETARSVRRASMLVCSCVVMHTSFCGSLARPSIVAPRSGPSAPRGPESAPRRSSPGAGGSSPAVGSVARRLGGESARGIARRVPAGPILGRGHCVCVCVCFARALSHGAACQEFTTNPRQGLLCLFAKRGCSRPPALRHSRMLTRPGCALVSLRLG